MHHTTQRTLLAAAAAATFAFAGCASAPPKNPALEQAHADYAVVSQDPDAVRSAAADLQRANEALQRADALQRDGKGTEAVDHEAYLAKQRIEIARQAGQLARTEQAITASGTQRDRILLSARTQEADRLRMEADRSRTQADQAQLQAEQARLQVAQANQQAEQARQQALAAATQADALAAQLSELHAQQTQRGLVLTIGDVLFDTGRATLNPGASRAIDQLAAFLKDNPGRTVQIEGYTDSTGSAALNRSLSENRADSVRAALVERGIAASRVAAVGMGESNPVATNATADGRQQNRRIEIVVSNAT